MYRKTRIIIILAFLLIAGNANAFHVYWKPNSGNDANAGTSTDKPVKTLTRAIEVLKAQYQENPNPYPKADWIIVQMEQWVIANTDNGEIVIDGKIDNTHNALVLRLPSMRDNMIKYSNTTNSGSNTLKLSNIIFHGNSVQNSWSSGNGNQNDPIIVIGAGRTLIMEGGCVLTENQHTHPATEILNGAGVVINGGGTLVMNGGEISKCKSNNYGGGVYGQNGATFIMNGGKIDNCFAAGTANYGESNAHPRGSGGGIYLSAGSTMTMTGGEISNCTAYQFGGGVKVQGSTDNQTIVTITKCNVHHCIADGPQDNYGRGGGFDFGSNVEVTIDGSEVLIHDNFCQCYGGGIQLQGGPTMFFRNGKVYENVADRSNVSISDICGAAGIHSTSDSKLFISGGEIYDNYTTGVGGGIHTSYEGTMEIIGGKIYNNHAACQGGAINLNTNCNLLFPEGSTVEMYGNTAGRGGAVCCDAASVWIYDGSFHDNHAVDTVSQTSHPKGFGGAFELNMESTHEGYEFLPSKVFIYGGEIYNNTASVDGGAIHLKKNSIKPTAGVPIIRIQGGEIHDNIAYKGNGGAIFADNQTTFYMEKNTVVSPATEGAIYDNESQLGSGGAIYLESAEVHISAGSFTENKAHLDGGGFYVNGETAVVNIEGGQLNGNNAGLNGGGFSVNGGCVTITGGNIQNNTATTGNGGGFFVNSGDVTINDGLVSGNSSVSGAGAYIDGGNFTFTSGSVTGNTASSNGGGAYVSSGVVKFKGNISDNSALNGGGLYLGPGASMEFQGGLIINNQADTTLTTSVIRAKTAYHGGADVPGWGSSVIEGCGGGIYLQSGTSSDEKTTLTFKLDPNDKTFGLYTNRAQKGGDDIVSEGLNTEVILPSVREMQLYGFEGKDATPFWYQDYFTGDTGYENHPDDGRAVTNAVNYIGRYREMINLFTNEYYNHRIADDSANLDRIKDFYLCLTLSYNMLDITISAKYLLGHETALFQLVRHGGTEDYKYDVLLRGDKTDSTTGLSSRTLRNMPWGTYSIFPNDAWNWAYDKIAPQQNLRLGETGNYEFVFEMNHLNGAQVPQHDERQPVKPSGH